MYLYLSLSLSIDMQHIPNGISMIFDGMSDLIVEYHRYIYISLFI